MNLPAPLKHIMLLSGEPSGDFHAAHLVREIKRRQPLVHFSGIGGPCMRQEKVRLFYNIEHLSVMGVTEVLMQFRHIKDAFDTFKKQLKQHQPDLIILTDYPGFNLKAAQYVKEHCPVKILYFITPKVWAWKKSRLSVMPTSWLRACSTGTVGYPRSWLGPPSDAVRRRIWRHDGTVGGEFPHRPPTRSRASRCLGGHLSHGRHDAGGA